MSANFQDAQAGKLTIFKIPSNFDKFYKKAQSVRGQKTMKYLHLSGFLTLSKTEQGR